MGETFSTNNSIFFQRVMSILSLSLSLINIDKKSVDYVIRQPNLTVW